MPAINVARTDTFEVQRVKINQLGNHAGDTNRSLGDFTKLHECLIGSEISDFKLTPLSSGIRKFKEYLDGL